MGRRVEVHLGPLGEHLAGQLVDLDDPLDLVAEEVDAHDVLAVRRLDLEDVAADPELRAAQRGVVALVLEVDEVAEDPVAPVVPAALEVDDGRAVVDRRARGRRSPRRDATMITSRRSNSARVALCRSRSISSLRDESFSMYVSVRGR